MKSTYDSANDIHLRRLFLLFLFFALMLNPISSLSSSSSRTMSRWYLSTLCTRARRNSTVRYCRRGRVTFLLVVFLTVEIAELEFFRDVGDCFRVLGRACYGIIDIISLKLGGLALGRCKHISEQATHGVSPHLEDQITKVQNQKQDRHSVTHRQQISALTIGQLAGIRVTRTRADGKVESRRDEHGDNRNEQ